MTTLAEATEKPLHPTLVRFKWAADKLARTGPVSSTQLARMLHCSESTAMKNLQRLAWAGIHYARVSDLVQVRPDLSEAMREVLTVCEAIAPEGGPICYAAIAPHLGRTRDQIRRLVNAIRERQPERWRWTIRASPWQSKAARCNEAKWAKPQSQLTEEEMQERASLELFRRYCFDRQTKRHAWRAGMFPAYRELVVHMHRHEDD